MKVYVTYTAQLGVQLGVSDESVELPDTSSTSDLLATLRNRHGDTFARHVLDATGALLPSIVLCLDDQQVIRGSKVPIRPDARVSFISAISGG